MKKLLALLLALTCVLSLTACGEQKKNDVTDGAQTEGAATGSGEVVAVGEANGFELKLYADKSTYSTSEEIDLWATLEYKGDQKKIRIWHGEPYITFTISDGKEFHTGGMIMTILTSTELERGEIYAFLYRKSGGFSESDADADFWKEFYAEEALKLPAGTYTVTVSGAFHTSQDMRPEEKGPSCSLQIEVTEA